MATEKELLRGARKYNQEALAEIYDHYSPALYRYAVRLLGDKDHAEECVAETFSRFLQVLKNGGGPKAHLQAYLYRVAHNWISDFYRNQNSNPLELDEEVNSEMSTNPKTRGSDVYLRNQIRKALMKLTPEQRQVIVLKYLEGLSNAEVARVLRKTVGATKSLQNRGLTTLNRLLKDLYK